MGISGREYVVKWAHFGISAVRYNTEHTHLEKVLMHPDDRESIGRATEQNRVHIIAAIKKGITFVTILKSNEGKWKKGQPVRIIMINGTEYIKTEENPKECDNLEHLPDF